MVVYTYEILISLKKYFEISAYTKVELSATIKTASIHHII